MIRTGEGGHFASGAAKLTWPLTISLPPSLPPFDAMEPLALIGRVDVPPPSPPACVDDTFDGAGDDDVTVSGFVGFAGFFREALGRGFLKNKNE